MYGMQLASAPSFRPEWGEAWDVPKAYWTAFPQSLIDDARQAMAELGIEALPAEEPEDGTPWACPDEWITTCVSDVDLEPRKQQALRAHRSQITDDAPFFQLARVLGPQALGTEHYRLVKGVVGPRAADGREDDLLAGLDLNG
jgi:N-acetyl-1-D-myo-inositol-2-amino-2-deoxy-alpha-D-glucopyranoside deacetylase